MSQDNVTKTVSTEQTSIITKLVDLFHGSRNQRVAIGQRFHELVTTGMSITTAIAAVKARLPAAPEFYIGAKLTVATVKALIAIAESVRKGGLIHGNHHVTEADIALFQLNPEQQAALMTSLRYGIEGRPGVSVASAASAARTIREHGLDSEKGRKALDKLMTRVVEVGGYRKVEAGSREALEIDEREALAAVERAEKALARAQERLNKARTALRNDRRNAVTAEVEPQANGQARTRTPRRSGKAATPGATPVSAAPRS